LFGQGTTQSEDRASPARFRDREKLSPEVPHDPSLHRDVRDRERRALLLLCEAGMSEAQQKLQAAAQAISTAVTILRMEMQTIEAFLKECRDMENFGHIVDPTLYNKSERRAVAAVVEPLFKAAVVFVRAHDEQLSRSRAALDKVNAA
jgi:hypothetical protein